MSSNKLRKGFTGWVYVMTNASYPCDLKIGMTTRPPSKRAAELSRTGVKSPWVVASCYQSRRHELLERETHRALHHSRVRGTEIFENVDTGAALATIKTLLDKHGDGLDNDDRRKAAAIKAKPAIRPGEFSNRFADTTIDIVGARRGEQVYKTRPAPNKSMPAPERGHRIREVSGAPVHGRAEHRQPVPAPAPVAAVEHGPRFWSEMADLLLVGAGVVAVVAGVIGFIGGTSA
jgi:hypothetical protein